MVMELVFDVRLDGELDQPRLDRFTKLLNLRPRGRLTDTEDAKFGHRALRDAVGEWLWLDLWRRDGHGWSVRLTVAGPPAPPPLVARCRAEVLGAAEALGLAVSGIWPAPAEPVPVAERLTLPAQRSLSARLTGGRRTAGWLSVADLRSVQQALALEREFGGLTGTEFGWRYPRWEPATGGSLLLQLSDHPTGGTELTLLHDRRPPSREVVAEQWQCWQATAERTGLTLERPSPGPATEG
ncbi:hypothetical protein [Plantactinospora sp. WMMB782]|uniref:hypothetical protein n=1 Tax=Plantactinospora sp. WMMB782 TaxID=3404121 RepID=UPI003B938A41